MKTCSRCNLPKGPDSFNREAAKKDGLSSWCRQCVKDYRTENDASIDAVKGAYYQANKQSYRDRAADLRERTRKIILEAKDVPCEDCGVVYPSYVMDFDHRDPAQKRMSVPQAANYGVKALLVEIAKCDVVCANCHRERTFG